MQLEPLTLDQQIEWAKPYTPCIRIGTWDLAVFAEQIKYAPLAIETNSTVLDLGANIGAFALWAFHNGASTVHCYEPESENEALLRFNLRGKNVTIFPFAVSGTKQKELKVVAGGNHGMHSFVDNPQVEVDHTVEVYTHDLERALWLTKPQYMKVDIEYSELYLDWSCIKHQKQLQRFVVEWHFALGTDYRLKAIECDCVIRENGYEQFSDWSIPNSGESVLGFYRRI